MPQVKGRMGRAWAAAVAAAGASAGRTAALCHSRRQRRRKEKQLKQIKGLTGFRSAGIPAGFAFYSHAQWYHYPGATHTDRTANQKGAKDYKAKARCQGDETGDTYFSPSLNLRVVVIYLRNESSDDSRKSCDAGRVSRGTLV